MTKKAVILFSGGLDSTTCLAKACHEGFTCFPIFFDYGQKHISEHNAAKKITDHYGCKLKVFSMPALGELGASALTDKTIDIPDFIGDGEIPPTYVPSRNIVFLSIAYSYAETLGARDIFIGTSSIDYSGYPDCRPEFINAFANMANLGTKAGVEGQPFNLHTPLISLSKAQTVMMIRANASKGIFFFILRDENMTHFRMHHAMTDCIMRNRATTNAGANG